VKKNLFYLLLLFVPVSFCAAQIEEGVGGRLSSVSASLSAAHISLPPETRIRVTNLETDRNIVVVVNQRLNADSNRLVELTVPAAEAIGLRDEARVRVERLQADGSSAPPDTAAGQSPARGEAKTEKENPLPGFYYVNSHDGDYPGNEKYSEPSAGRKAGPPSGESSPQTQPVQERPVFPAQLVQREGTPPSPPPGTEAAKEMASVHLLLPADTGKVLLSMDRDESGKLWVYVESEAAREEAVTGVPKAQALPAPAQTPAKVQTPPAPVPPPKAQTPPVPPPPAQIPSKAQTPPPEHKQVTVTVIPRLPPAGDGKRYVLQVGSYQERSLADYHLFNLKNAEIAAVMEPYEGAIRIIIKGVYAEDIPALAEKLGKTGITEIWVRDQ
jgi:hypothetical protein